MRSHPFLGCSGFKKFTAPSLRSIDEKVSTPLLRKEMRYMRRIIVPVILALVMAALVVGAALATTPKGVTPTPLTRATLGNFEAENKGKADAVLYVTFIAPTKTPADGLVLLDPKPKGCNVK